ncbi:ISNCY family transposase [Legionella londiniensis]|nr:ISNCY family transposase [Legionella londiniensis]
MYRFENLYKEWKGKRLTQEEAARALGVCDRTFRRYISSFEAEGMQGLADLRISQISHKRAPVDEITRIVDLYRNHYLGWNVNHFYGFYCREHRGTRSYSWVKNVLQKEGLVAKESKRGPHGKRRERTAMAGMMLHQDGSSHQWVPGKEWDLIITFDDATSEHYSMFFILEEGTDSSFKGVRETIEKKGLFCSLYTDRGSHYWYTPEADKRVDKTQYTQFRRAMRQLGIEMIPAYSPEARGRCERQFRTHQGRLPKELALHGITEINAANKYLKEVYMPAFNREFTVNPLCKESAFVPWNSLIALDDILCEKHERVVGKDNCVSFKRLSLQIPKDNQRCHYMRARVKIHRYISGDLAIFYGPRKLAEYDSKGILKMPLKQQEYVAA